MIVHQWISMCRDCDGDRLFYMTFVPPTGSAPSRWEVEIGEPGDFGADYPDPVCHCPQTEGQKRDWEADQLAEFLGETRFCRVCGCDDEDCSACIERTGESCSWVEEDLCSACVGVEVAS